MTARVARSTIGAALAALLMGALACTSPSDPFHSGPGHASVAGVVTDPGGAPLAGTTVRITCPGRVATTVTTDTLGHYLSGLSTSAITGTSSHLTCRFREPASGTARLTLDTLIGFARGPVLVPLQTIDLREGGHGGTP